jgi:hypothetical protein
LLKRNVFINAGLGNQLFQYSFAHHDALDKELEINISIDSQPREDRPFELNPLLEFCTHQRGSIKKTNRPVFIGRTRKILSRLLPTYIQSIASELLIPNFEVTQFDYRKKRIRNSGLIVGYFQHWNLVEDAWRTFGPEIQSLIEKTAKNSLVIRRLLSESKPLVVAHVRRGDLVNLTSTMGVLDFSYYENALKQIPAMRNGYKLIVVTDDITGAKPITNLLLPDEVLGPRELNSLETLTLMSMSDFVISANSTLSWWGGYLALKRGATSFIPFPWFKNWTPEVGSAFNFPGFKILPAAFIASGKFQSDFTLES